MPKSLIKRLSNGKTRKISNPSKTLMRTYVKTANSELNLFQNLNELEVYSSNITGNKFRITCMKYKDCSQKLFSWMMRLLEKNMSDLYKDCEWGWDFESKRKEMSHCNSRFLVVYQDIEEKPIAFSHFQFDMDYNINVLYCYELQLDESARKQGLGKHLMTILEALCLQFKMKKVILTVFNHNKNALDFFVSQGYVVDETSPQNFSIESFYTILSKPMILN